jgi:hypothetical protein
MLEILKDEWRLLTFRAMGPGVRTRYWAYLAFGLIATWIAGLGRYWDNPRAAEWQQLGLGSLAYVFVLSLVLWLIVWPLRPSNWTWRNVLLFVTLTSPPAVLYAVPVERFMSAGDARLANMLFLAVVAAWRVALYWRFLRGPAKLSGAAASVALLLPLALIVVALSFFNLEHAVFNIMAGIGEGTSADAAYFVVLALSVMSTFGAPVILLAYLGIIWFRWGARKTATRSADTAGAPPADGPDSPLGGGS